MARHSRILFFVFTVIAVGAVVAFIIFWPDLLLRMVGE